MHEPGVPKPPESPPAFETADRLLAKVVAVWFWSVFFGLNSGLSYNYLTFFIELLQSSRAGFGGPRPPDILLLVRSIAGGVGVVASFGAWIFLYLFFSAYLLPVLFVGVTAVSEERRRRAGATFLNRAYLLLLLAAVARLAPELMTFAAALPFGI